MTAPRHFASNNYPGAIVPYTVVSRGRVLGTTEFEYVRWRKGFRGGSFSPAANAASLVEIAVGVSPATITLGKKIREMDRQADQNSPTTAARLPHLKTTTEHADVVSACDREAALELELRAPDGKLIATEWIALQDTEFLLSLDDGEIPDAEDHEEWSDSDSNISTTGMSTFDEDDLFNECERWREDLDFEWSDEGETPFPRYQIFVALVNDDAVP